MKSISILGVRVDAISRTAAREMAEAMLQNGFQHHIVTPNPEMILLAQKDAEFKRILNNSALALPDGAGICWAARKLGIEIERITGTDFLLDLAELAQKKSRKIALIGGEAGIAEAAAKELQKRYAGLQVKGFNPGRIDENNVPSELLNKLKNFASDMVMVALGAPGQEKFIAKLLPLVPSIKIAIGVGGALDYISGEKRRAPKWMRENSLEWLWRLIQEPRRLPRIWNAAVRFPLIFSKILNPKR